jgi:hypothetical protein
VKLYIVIDTRTGKPAKLCSGCLRAFLSLHTARKEARFANHYAGRGTHTVRAYDCAPVAEGRGEGR